MVIWSYRNVNQKCLFNISLHTRVRDQSSLSSFSWGTRGLYLRPTLPWCGCGMWNWAFVKELVWGACPSLYLGAAYQLRCLDMYPNLTYWLTSQSDLSPTSLSWTHPKTIPRPGLLLHQEQQVGALVWMDTALSKLAASLCSSLAFLIGQPDLADPKQQGYFTQ